MTLTFRVSLLSIVILIFKQKLLIICLSESPTTIETPSTNGSWSIWTDWSSCSFESTKIRNRTCLNEKQCLGNSIENQTCDTSNFFLFV